MGGWSVLVCQHEVVSTCVSMRWSAWGWSAQGGQHEISIFNDM